MKQKYAIELNKEKNELTIKEFAEVDKEILSLICMETYDRDHIESALAKGKAVLIAQFRTRNMYPPAAFADKIADSIMTLCGSPNGDAIELLLDDRDFLVTSRKAPEGLEGLEGEPVEIDELLEDDFHEQHQEKEAIERVNSTIKIAADAALNVEDAH